MGKGDTGSPALTFRSVAVRTLMAWAAIAGAMALGGCDPEQLKFAKSMKPLSAETLALIEQKNMDNGSPIVVRVFKEEAELEVWKQDRGGRFQMLRTYPICRWSGELGPKVKEGDRQAPEGFYTITQANLNPNSAYYLSINIGYPNEFDRAWNRSGSALMIHGDCSSRGCYAMTNDQIGEIYGLARESFLGGQRAFQIQAYPFRMTALNMAKHRNNPNMSFWRMLKQGNDMFEVSGVQPTVNVCEKRYVFNAEAPAGSTQALKFNPAGRCPAYTIDQPLADAMAQKTQADDAEIAELSKRTATVPVKTGRDGGMHPSFLAKVTKQVRDADGTVRTVIDENAASTLGTYVTVPHDANAPPNEFATVYPPAPASAPAADTQIANVPMPRPAPHRRGTPVETAGDGSTVMSLASSDSRAAPATESSNPISRVGSTVAKWIGFGDDDKKPVVTAPPKPRPVSVATHKPMPAAKPAPVVAAHSPSAETATPRKPPPAPDASATAANTMAGAAPVVPADTFESRWAPAR
jgi:murein L,D-transpeptidase YafK